MKEKVQQQFDIPLHDIKPIVEVQEYSMYYFIALLIGSILLVLLLSYFIYLWYKKRNSFNLREYHLQKIHELDLSDTKATAYALSQYGLTFKDDSPRHLEMYKNISERLMAYKYKKNVDAFDEETKGYIELYRGMLDV